MFGKNFQRKYALTDQGVKNTKKGAFWTVIVNLVVMGGMGSISGSVLAAFIVTIGQEWLRVLDGPLPFLPFWPESGVSGMRMVVFSVLLLIIILFFRNGLFGHKEVTWSSIGKRLAALSGHGKGVKSDE